MKKEKSCTKNAAFHCFTLRIKEWTNILRRLSIVVVVAAVMDSPPAKSWSIHTRPEIIAKYQILERVGSGAYSDVYRARSLSGDLTVALKGVHDYQSAVREIEALQTLHSCPNAVVLYKYFWREDEDAVLVLEFVRSDLECDQGGEVKRWMLQMLCGIDACHRNMIVHRDLKPSNLLVGEDGVLKLADCGQV